MPSAQNLFGMKFNRLSVISETPVIRNKKTLWLCACDCGNELLVRADSLKTGHTESCGCKHAESVSLAVTKRNTTHGLRHHPMYNMWFKMIERCSNPKNKSFRDYGAKGITVSDRWRGSFEFFLKNMGERPSPSHEIDRINNSLGYFKENCRWVTRTENARNKSTTFLNAGDVREIKSLLSAGKAQSEIAKQYSVSKYCIHDIARGKSWKDIHLV